MRKRGYSINEIGEQLDMPKTTVWHHVQKVRVLPRYVSVLKSRQGGSRKRTKKNWEQARLEARRLLDSKHRELCIAAAMLYWAEGNKGSSDFVNSNANIIRVYLTFVRRILKVPNSRLRVTARLVSRMDKDHCIKHWSRVTGIPVSNMRLFINDGGSRSRTQYGMCRIAIGKGGANALKLVYSLIDLYSDEVLKSRSRPS